jgi:DNA-binding HxlR family transcriptional regulator
MGTGEGNGIRAGTLGLRLLASPVNFTVLQALAEKSKTLDALSRLTGFSAAAMQRQLEGLMRVEVVEGRRLDAFSGSAKFGLTASGQGLIDVAAILGRWLAMAPDGGLRLGEGAAAEQVRTVTDGWAADLVRVLAAGPLSGDELKSLLSGIGPDQLERVLEGISRGGLAEPAGAESPSIRPTRLLRHAVAPLAASAQWEQANSVPGAGPVSRFDVEAAFLLATPMVALPSQADGTCRLAVEVPAATGRRPAAGVVVTVERGRVVSCLTSLSQSSSWVTGSPTAWLAAVVDGRTEGLVINGSGPLAPSLLASLHITLFGPGQPPLNPT